jgi:hypothetical protein
MTRDTTCYASKDREPCILFICIERVSLLILRNFSQGLSLAVRHFKLVIRLQTVNTWNAILHDQENQASVIDVSLWLTRTTLDIIGNAAFGYNFNAIDGGGTELYNAYHNL